MCEIELYRHRQSDALKHSSNTAVTVVSGASGHDIYLPSHRAKRTATDTARAAIVRYYRLFPRSIVNSDGKRRSVPIARESREIHSRRIKN